MWKWKIMENDELCKTCVHVVKDGNKPVACLTLIECVNKKTCMFYKVHPLYDRKKEWIYFMKPLWNKYGELRW